MTQIHSFRYYAAYASRCSITEPIPDEKEILKLYNACEEKLRITLPYGCKTTAFNVAASRFLGFLDPPETSPANDFQYKIEQAIHAPYGDKTLAEIIRPGKRIAVIVDDASRPTPIAGILPVLLKELIALGAKKRDVRIIVALGSHRYMTEKELRERVGDDIYENYEVVNSEFSRPEGLVYVGKTIEGVDILASKCVVDCDIHIGIGCLLPHPVMGWGGGGKILYPGIAGEKTVAYFHLKASLYNENFFGLESTPVREMMEEWVKHIGLDFIINVILNSKQQLVDAVAGHYIEAHRAGVEKAKKISGCRVKEKADIVIVSSHPADQDFWQSPKAFYAAERALKGAQGGTMILVSPNFEGIGPHAEYPYWMGRNDGDETAYLCMDGSALGDPLAIAVGNSMSKLRRRRRLVVVSDGVTGEEMKICGCIWYPLAELQKAIDEEIKLYPYCRIAVISNGAETLLYE